MQKQYLLGADPEPLVESYKQILNSDMISSTDLIKCMHCNCLFLEN